MTYTDRMYSLKDGETGHDWMKALCAKLNEVTEGVEYSFREWGSFANGCCIDAHKTGMAQISIVSKPPKWKSQGDIGRVNVRADEIYGIDTPRLNRSFKVSKDGSINIAGVHKCIQERITEIERGNEELKKKAESYSNRKKLVRNTIKGTGIKATHYRDASGVRLTKKDQDFNGTVNVADVSIRVRPYTVPFERIDAFFKAHHKLMEAIHGDPDAYDKMMDALMNEIDPLGQG
jgi:hypothetical protein